VIQGIGANWGMVDEQALFLVPQTSVLF